MRDYASGTCVPKSTCGQMSCGPDSMFITFTSGLFGIQQNELKSPFEDDGSLRSISRPAPTWNAETEKWSLRCVLGECGMKPTIADG